MLSLTRVSHITALTLTVAKPIEEHTDLEWNYLPGDLGYEYERGSNNPIPRIASALDESNMSFCIPERWLEGVSWSVANAFNTSGQLWYYGCDFYFKDDLTAKVVEDIIGTVACNCSQLPGLGFDGFKSLVNNVAVGLTNV